GRERDAPRSRFGAVAGQRQARRTDGRRDASSEGGARVPDEERERDHGHRAHGVDNSSIMSRVAKADQGTAPGGPTRLSEAEMGAGAGAVPRRSDPAVQQ